MVRPHGRGASARLVSQATPVRERGDELSMLHELYAAQPARLRQRMPLDLQKLTSGPCHGKL